MTTVIDLDTGERVESTGDSAIPISQEDMPTIINLDTGEREQLVPPSVLGDAARRKQIEAESLSDQQTDTRAVQELPEIGFSGLLSGEDPVKVAQIATALAVTPDPREMGNILTSVIPHIGVTEDEQGNLIAANNRNGVQVVINKPGASGIDAIQGIATGAAFTPAASVVGGVISTAPRAIAGMGVANLTQTAIELLQEQLGGEMNADEIAIATVLGGAAEVVVPTINGIRNIKQRREVADAIQAGEDVSGQVALGQQASEATGIPLFQAQQTTIPSQLEQQAFLAQLPAGTQKASRELANQNRKTSEAVNSFLAQIAPDESIITGPGRIRTAAQRAIDERVLIREERSSPLYQRAFREGADVDLQPVNELIELTLEGFPKGGEVYRSASKVAKLISGKPTLKKLHNAKLEIDQMLSKVGESSLGNTTKRQLVGIKEVLLEQLDNSSALYRKARKTFEENSPPVNQIQESIIGKIAKLDDKQLKTVSRTIFDPMESNPQIVKQAKQVITDIDPDAWNQIVRAEIERRLGAIKSTLEEGTTENIPGQMFRAIFGNVKQREVLFNAVDGEMKTNLKYLQTALSRAKLGRPGGSQTAFREDFKRELQGGIGFAIRNFFSKPVSAFAGAGVSVVTGSTADAAFNNRVRAFAEIMFDPQWRPSVRELRQLDPTSPAAARAMMQLLDDALVSDLESLPESQEQLEQAQ